MEDIQRRGPPRDREDGQAMVGGDRGGVMYERVRRDYSDAEFSGEVYGKSVWSGWRVERQV